MNKTTGISNADIIDNLNDYPEDLLRDVGSIIIIRDYNTMSVLKKNYPGTTYVEAQVI